VERETVASPAHCKTENPSPMAYGLGSKGNRPCRVGQPISSTYARPCRSSVF
jgi:hypothetical protein